MLLKHGSDIGIFFKSFWFFIQTIHSIEHFVLLTLYHFLAFDGKVLCSLSKTGFQVKQILYRNIFKGMIASPVST